MRRALAFAALLLFGSSAYAACTGSGQNWNCAAGTTISQVSAAISSATDGAVITFASGTYSWSGGSANFSNSKGATLICATPGACTVNVGGTVLGMNGNCSGTNTKLYRISGFRFQGGASPIWFNAYNAPPCTLHNIRIDHNTFSGQQADTRILQFGDNSNNSFFYGVIDHNTVTNSSSLVFAEFYGGNGNGAPAGTRGTANNMFFENNTFTITNMTNGGAGCMDSTGSPGVVWRYNVQTNCRLASHGTTSGGMVNWEVYGNDLTCNSGFTDCYRSLHHQGSGETIAFDNVFRPSSAPSEDIINWLHYRSASPSEAGYSGVRCDGNAAGDGNRPGQYGYPCKRQPGRDVNGILNPLYFWNNRLGSGGRVPFECVNHVVTSPIPPQTCVNHVVANRDTYDAVGGIQTSPSSPFNGSSGMGFGTLANRPTSCTPTPQAADAGRGGVGYWATDAGGNWNQANGTANDGALYRCSAANTWTLHYTPYAYPHPLVGGVSPPPPQVTPNPPTGILLVDATDPDPDPEPMAITLDATTSASGTATTGPLTISNFTATTGSALVVSIALGGGGSVSVTGVSYNGQSLTERYDANPTGFSSRVAVYVGVAGADGSPHDVTITLGGDNGGNHYMAVASSWSGVETSSVDAMHRTIYSDFDNSAGDGADVTVVDSQSGDVVIAQNHVAATTITNNQTDVVTEFNNTAGNGHSFGVEYTAASGASTVMSWTGDNFCTVVGFALVPAAAGGATAPTLRVVRSNIRIN